MKLRVEYLGEAKKENIIHILTSDKSVDMLLEAVLAKAIPPIFRDNMRSKFARIHEVRKVQVEFFNYNFIVELIPKTRGGKNEPK